MFGKEVKRGMALGIGLLVGFTIMMIVIGTALAWVTIPGFTTQEPTTEQYKLTLPLKGYVNDKIAGTALSSGTFYIYDMNGNLLESGSISSGVFTTTRAYTSGETYQIYITASGYYGYFGTITIPYAERTEQDYHYLTEDLYVVQTPSESSFYISVLDPVGNVLASESTSSTYSTSETQFTVYIRLTIPKLYGLVNVYDPTETDDPYDDVLVYIKMNNTLATADRGSRLEVGSYVYYVWKIPEDYLASKTDPLVVDIPVTIIYGGSSALSIQAFIADHTSVDYFLSAGSYDSDAVLTDSTQAGVIT